MAIVNKIFSCVILLGLQFYICYAIYSNCGSELGDVNGVEISGCDNSSAKCILRRNTNATFNLAFHLKQDVINVTAVVHGVVFDAPIPFNLPNPDGCIDSGLTCPLKSGGPYTYTASLPILKKYPKLNVDVKWELRNEEGKDIVCLLIPAQIS